MNRLVLVHLLYIKYLLKECATWGRDFVVDPSAWVVIKPVG